MSTDDWRPDANREALAFRAGLLEAIRAFLRRRGVLEVTTPLATRFGVTDPHLVSRVLAGGGYLRTSPEYAHKRLLAAGSGDIFEIGPVFRASEHGPLHLGEFTMLEYYRVGLDWRALASEVVELLAACGLHRPARFLAWRELARRVLGVDALAEDRLESLTADAPAGLDRAGKLDWLFALRLQPALPPNAITIIHDFPPEQAALARLRPGSEPVAERFEVFAGTVELANGYQELTDPEEQRRRFEADNQRRGMLGYPPMPADPRLLKALAAGLPECAGVALGIERLIMVLRGLDDLGGTQAFEHA